MSQPRNGPANKSCRTRPLASIPMAGQDTTRTTARRAAVRELALLVALYAAYSATRFVVGGDWGAARHHALQILEVEQLLHMDVERTINHAVTPITALSVFSAYWY